MVVVVDTKSPLVGRFSRAFHSTMHSAVASTDDATGRMNILSTAHAGGRSDPRGTTASAADGPAHSDTVRPPGPRRHRRARGHRAPSRAAARRARPAERRARRDPGGAARARRARLAPRPAGGPAARRVRSAATRRFSAAPGPGRRGAFDGRRQSRGGWRLGRPPCAPLGRGGRRSRAARRPGLARLVRRGDGPARSRDPARRHRGPARAAGSPAGAPLPRLVRRAARRRLRGRRQGPARRLPDPAQPLAGRDPDAPRRLRERLDALHADLRALTAAPSATTDLTAIRARRAAITTQITQVEKALEEAEAVLGPSGDRAGGSVAVAG
jgi:hypothetical protein